MFHYQAARIGEALVIRLTGDLDIEATEIVEEELTPLLLEAAAIEMDFSDVPFVDSSGIGLLITLIQSIHDRGGDIIITRLCAEVRHVFDLLQLSEIVGHRVFADRESA